MHSPPHRRFPVFFFYLGFALFYIHTYIYLSIYIFDLGYSVSIHFPGEGGRRGVGGVRVAGLDSTLCLCDASDGACCYMLTVARRNPPSPLLPTPLLHILLLLLLLHISGHPPSSAGSPPPARPTHLPPPQHLCLMSAIDSMKELERTRELQPKAEHCIKNKERVLPFYSVSMWGFFCFVFLFLFVSDRSSLCLAVEGPPD